MRRPALVLLPLLLSLACLLPCGYAEPRGGWDLASRVPSGTLVFVGAEGLDELQARWDRTSLGRMMADPAMQEFSAPLRKMWEQATGPETLPPLLRDLGGHLKHLQGQAGVAWVGMDAERGEPRVVASLDFGSHVQAFADFLERLAAEAGAESVVLEKSQREGRPWWKASLQSGPTLWATLADTVLVASTDEALLTAAVGAPAGESLASGADYAAVQRRYGPGLTMHAYANVPALAGAFSEGEMAAPLRAMGLDTVRAVGYGMSMVGDGFRDTLVVHTPGADHGLMTAFEARPLQASRLLDLVPGHAFFATESRIDLSGYLDGLRRMFASVDAGAVAEMDEDLREASRELGMDIEKELVAGLGDTLGMYAGMSSGGGLFPEVAFVVTVKDPAAWQERLPQLAARLAGMLGERGSVVARHRAIPYEGQVLQVLELQGAEAGEMVPFTPSAALLGDRLVVTLVPYTLKDIIYRQRHPEQAGPGLADQEDFAALWRDRPPQACSLGYIDLQSVLALLYDTAVPTLQAAAKPNVLGEMAAALPLDWTALPPVRHVRSYFRSVGIYQSLSRDGLDLQVSAPLPLFPVFGLAGAGAAMFAMRRAAMPGAGVDAVDPDAPMLESPVEVAQREVDDLARYVMLFVMERDQLPASLEALVAAGFVEELPLDPWGHRYSLTVVDAARREVTVASTGPDGVLGTDDDIALTRSPDGERPR
ncbi:MAG: type II secretion system protein GspG [Planctomycetia bacterium]